MPLSQHPVRYLNAPKILGNQCSRSTGAICTMDQSFRNDASSDCCTTERAP